MCGGTTRVQLKLMLACLSQTFSLLTLILPLSSLIPLSTFLNITHIWWSCLVSNLLTTLWEKDISDLMCLFSFTESCLAYRLHVNSKNSFEQSEEYKLFSIFLWSAPDYTSYWYFSRQFHSAVFLLWHLTLAPFAGCTLLQITDYI